MKKILVGTSIVVSVIILFTVPNKTYAKSAREKWLERYNYMQEYTMEIYNDPDLYSNYVPPSGEKKTNKSTAKNTISGNSASEAKGYVYGVDELHVTGLPTGEDGYTKPGDYGKIEK